MEVNQKEIIHPTRSQEEKQEKEEGERCLKASQSPCLPSLAPKSHKKQEGVPPHTNPFLPSSSNWEECLSPPSHHRAFPMVVPHQSSSPFLPPSSAADDPYPVLEETMEKHRGGHAPNPSHHLLAEEKEKKEISDSGRDTDHGHDHDHEHPHKKWFSFPKLDPRHRWPQGWC